MNDIKTSLINNKMSVLQGVEFLSLKQATNKSRLTDADKVCQWTLQHGYLCSCYVGIATTDLNN